MRERQDRRLGEGRTADLNTDWKAPGSEAARNRDRGQPIETEVRGVAKAGGAAAPRSTSPAAGRAPTTTRRCGGARRLFGRIPRRAACGRRPYEREEVT